MRTSLRAAAMLCLSQETLYGSALDNSMPAWAEELWRARSWSVSEDPNVRSAWDAASRLWQQEPWSQSCTLERVDLPSDALLDQGMLGRAPFIAAVPLERNQRLRDMLQRRELVTAMGNATCTPTAASSDRGDTEMMTVAEYVEEWLSREVSRNASENRYIFGEFGEEWGPYRDAYVLPPCERCTRDLVAVTIGLGGLYSGAPWHGHGAAFVEVLHGAKHFSFLPPSDPAKKAVDVSVRGLSQLHWHREKREKLAREGYLTGLIECTVFPGELLFFPPNWFHGVTNAGQHTAFVSTFLS